MRTPEGVVKDAVKGLLGERLGMYVYMPVPSGYGQQSIDFIGSFRGAFFAIETKRPGKKPTLRQEETLAEIRASGAATFVIDGAEEFHLRALKLWLDQIDKAIPYDPRLAPAPRARRPI